VKAVVCQEVGRFELSQLEEPLSPHTGEAIVRIRRVGICGTDIHAYKGNQPFFSYPRLLGHELAGIVEELGSDDSGLAVGDQVSVIPYMACGSCIACRKGKTNCCSAMQVLGVHRDGGMRERLTIPVSHLIRTEGMTLDQAALLEPFSIGAHAIRRSDLREGETVLVIGAGPIGLGVMALAKRQGARVIAMDVKDKRLSFCREWAHVDATINALTDHVEERLMELTEDEMPTVVFEATGNAASMTESFQLAAHGGTLVFVGLVREAISFSDPEFHKRELSLLASRNATRADFELVIEAMQEGALDVERYITHRAPFDQMPEIWESWMEPNTGIIKAMLEL